MRRRQKPRPEIALGNFAIDNRRAEPAVYEVMSAEIAAGNFGQSNHLTGNTVERVTVRIAKLDCTLATLGRRVRC